MAKSDTEKRNYLPSPPIGYRVLWREAGGKNVHPADVIEASIGEPGVLAISVNFGNRWQKYEAVHWENHPGADNIQTPNIRHRGTWCYMPNETIPDAHYQVHRDLVKQTEINRQRQEEYIAEQKRLNEEAHNQPVDPIAVAVAREQAAAILQGSA